MCSAQIGCEANKHYFSTEFSYKMARNLPVRIGWGERKKRDKKQKLVAEGKRRNGHGAGFGGLVKDRGEVLR